MKEGATAVAVLQGYQMDSGGYLVHPPTLSRANSTFRVCCSGLFSAQGQIPALSKLFQCSLISQMKSENSRKAKSIPCLPVLLFCGYVYVSLCKPAPLSIFLYVFVTWRVSNPLIYLILFTFFRTEKQWRGKKNIGRKFQFLSFKSFSICAEDGAGLEITCCFWHNPLGFEDVRVESISDLCCFQQQRQLLELKDWGSILDSIEKDAVYCLISNLFLAETIALPGCCWGCRQVYLQETIVLW